MESTWALDVLNILLYDDNSIPYFGLGNMPGLLEAILEHWRSSLFAMLGVTKDLEVGDGEDDLQRPPLHGRESHQIRPGAWKGRRSCNFYDKSWKAISSQDGGAQVLDSADILMHDIAEEQNELPLGCAKHVDLEDKVLVMLPKTASNRHPRIGKTEVEMVRLESRALLSVKKFIPVATLRLI